MNAMQTNTEQYEICSSHSGLVEKLGVLECYTILNGKLLCNCLQIYMT
jgi:hypothetical protein